MSEKTKIVGLRKAVHDTLWAPKGFHCEIWAKRNDRKVELWTSEYLAANSWTTGIEGWKRIDRYARQYKDSGYTWTASIRIAIAELVE